MNTTTKLSCLMVLLLSFGASAASTGITTKQTQTAAPGLLNLSVTSPAEGTSLAHAKADHVHGVTGTLAQTNGGTGAGALTCDGSINPKTITSNGTLYSCGVVPLTSVNLSGTLSEALGGTGAGALTCTNQFVTSNGTLYSCVTATLASAQFVNQGTTTTLLHGNAVGNPSWSGVSLTADVTGILGEPNGGTGAGALTCTNQFVTSNGTLYSCSGATLASAQFANQGATTTLLHGNAAGNPTWAAVALATAEVSGTLPQVRGGTGSGAMTCATDQRLTSGGTAMSCATNAISVNSTLQGAGSIASPLGVNLNTTNVWTARVTFSSSFFGGAGTPVGTFTGGQAGIGVAGDSGISATGGDNDSTNDGAGKGGVFQGGNDVSGATTTGAAPGVLSTGGAGAAGGKGSGEAGVTGVGGSNATGTGTPGQGLKGTGGAASSTSTVAGGGDGVFGTGGVGFSSTKVGGIGGNFKGGDGGSGGTPAGPGVNATAGAATGTNTAGSQAFFGAGGAATGNASSTTGGLGGPVLSGTAGVGGPTATGTGGAGGDFLNGTGGVGGAASGAGTGGNGGRGGVFAGGASGGGSVNGGTGGTGATATGGNGVATNGGGGDGFLVVGGNAVGTGNRGDGINVSAGQNGSGTTRGYVIRMNQPNTIMAHMLFNSLTADPSAPATGDFWMQGATNSQVLKLRNGAETSTLLGTGTKSPVVQRLRTAGCATAASLNATCNTTVTWPTAFADTNYTVDCSGNTVTSGIPSFYNMNTKAAGSLVAVTISLTAAAAQFTNIECVAIHD